ncbi:POZ domain-containing protein [Coniophora puteana RWD-64-598 SS2]|uniref:Elongin-C n=1 Tax=Coniophora puteana (strain RWD-64-598) TaxID=741705 RepID=A0A5M3M8T6_CONPW|nr:POZ domain-containing protein [Coniophora puteana RWD-64-598 SS2]EIW75682.1 POZ domain-containing protein [Coniophora puteana RWD-64-598 SS2]
MTDVDMNGADDANGVDAGNDWVRIKSADGFSFLVKRRVAMASGTLRNMLSADSNFKEALANTCPIEERAAVVEKVCEYMSFKAHHENAPPREEIPVNEFTERIPPEIALELLLAADYLEDLSEAFLPVFLL